MKHASDAEILAFMEQEYERCTIDWNCVLRYLRNSKHSIERRMADLWDRQRTWFARTRTGLVYATPYGAVLVDEKALGDVIDALAKERWDEGRPLTKFPP